MTGRRGALAAVVAVAALTGGACRDQRGIGEVSGAFFIAHCPPFHDRRSPAAYNLDPGFIAGEPFDDVRRVARLNRLVVRLQQSGKRVENNDVLTVDIVDSYEVARCVRGAERTMSGITVLQYRPSLCFRNGNVARVRVGPFMPVRAYFAPRDSCQERNNVIRSVVGTAVGTEDNIPGPEWESWIEFEQFGAAAQHGRPPGERDLVDVQFKVRFDERVHASAFRFRFTDDQVIKAVQRNEPPPAPEIEGFLEGSFDFDLTRGQGAQTFP